MNYSKKYREVLLKEVAKVDSKGSLGRSETVDVQSAKLDSWLQFRFSIRVTVIESG